MAIKKSVRLVDETIKELQALSRGEVNWSGSINSMAEYFRLFCEHCLPELSNAEKYAIAQSYNGHWFDRNLEEEVRTMHWQISEAVEYDENVVENLASEDVNPAKFIERVKSWNPQERLAVLVFVQRFWHSNKPIVEDGEQ